MCNINDAFSDGSLSLFNAQCIDYKARFENVLK